METRSTFVVALPWHIEVLNSSNRMTLLGWHSPFAQVLPVHAGCLSLPSCLTCLVSAVLLLRVSWMWLVWSINDVHCEALCIRTPLNTYILPVLQAKLHRKFCLAPRAGHASLRPLPMCCNDSSTATGYKPLQPAFGFLLNGTYAFGIGLIETLAACLRSLMSFVY